jgi:hypothetical protein
MASSILFAPVAAASTKAVKPAPVDYSDVTGPKIENVKVDKTSLNLRKKAATVKILITVSDDLNSVDDASAYFSRLDADGKITGPKLMVSKPKPSKRISSKLIDGRRVEVFEMTSTFPKGLAVGQYKMMTGDFRDMASNRRQDLSSTNSSDLLPIITVS